MTVTLIDNQTIQVRVEPDPVVTVLVNPEPVVEVRVLDGGVIFQGSGPAISPEYEIAIGVLQAYPNSYKEFTLTAGRDLSQIDVWDSPSKGIKLFTKRFIYTNDLLTYIVVTNEPRSVTVTRIFSYTAGNLVAINVVPGDQSP